MMEIREIEDIRLTAESQEAEQRRKVQTSAPEAKKCIYKKDIVCCAPDCKMEICMKCPYGAQSSLSAAVRDVFKKIINLAIFLVKSDDVLRDVINLLSKAEVQGQALENGPKDGRQNIAKKPQVKESIPEPIANPVAIKRVQVKPAVGAEGAGDAMAAQIAAKVADISEALANPNGSSGKPLL